MSIEDSEGVGQKMEQLVIRMSICSGRMPGGVRVMMGGGRGGGDEGGTVELLAEC
jgi:hypothetical protein